MTKMKRQKEPSLRSQLLEQEWKENAQCHQRGVDKMKLLRVTRAIAEAVCDFIDGTGFQMIRSDAGQAVMPFPLVTADTKTFGTDANLTNSERMRWYAAIDPSFPKLIKRRQELLKLLYTIKTKDERQQFAIERMHDFTNDLMFCLEELGCYLGVFIGAKLMGASEKELIALGKRLAKTKELSWG
jgi:hypothetical protein